MKLKLLFIFLFLWASLSTLHAQTIDFNYTNGTNASYNVSDVRKITFVNDIMNLHFNDGSVYSWNVSSIGYYTYDETLVNVDSYISKLNELKMNIFPNPTNNFLNISFNLPVEDNLIIAIYDLQGKIIFEKHLGNLNAGINTETIDMIGLVASNYIFKIYGKNVSFSKTIIKK
jgi:hypothetical protein